MANLEGRAWNVVFFTMAGNRHELESARLFAESLREFGGQLRSSPIWLFDFGVSEIDYDLLTGLGMKPTASTVPDSMSSYELAEKVHSCAEAERLAPEGTDALVWISPESVIVGPPDMYVLDEDHDVAVRPVHVKNVGIEVDEPVDSYWSRVLEIAGAEESQFAVESYVDRRRLRGYFNSHSYCVNPSLGLFRRWSDCFQQLVQDDEFQSASCSDDLRRIFLHQAILSALTISMVDSDRISVLPPTYCYPYNLHSSVPAEYRPNSLNRLTSFVYEELSIDPGQIRDIEINEPLRSWLKSRATRGD